VSSTVIVNSCAMFLVYRRIALLSSAYNRVCYICAKPLAEARFCFIETLKKPSGAARGRLAVKTPQESACRASLRSLFRRGIAENVFTASLPRAAPDGVCYGMIKSTLSLEKHVLRFTCSHLPGARSVDRTAPGIALSKCVSNYCPLRNVVDSGVAI
jgi:hypothetical protein